VHHKSKARVSAADNVCRRKTLAPAPALRDLIRLLARQAAREWLASSPAIRRTDDKDLDGATESTSEVAENA
jgi:hypothetical protein